jgi:hypothetical protein
LLPPLSVLRPPVAAEFRPSAPWLTALASGAPTTGTGETTVLTTLTVTLQTVLSRPPTTLVSTVVACPTMPRSIAGRPRIDPWMWSPGFAVTVLPQGTVLVSAAEAVPGMPSTAEPARTNAVAPTAVALRVRSCMLAAPCLASLSQDNDVKAAR